MSHRHGTSWITGAYVFGGGGLGVLAENIPTTGDNGGSYLYPAVALPADNGKEICGRVTTWPMLGPLIADENGAFTYTPSSGGPDFFEYRLIVDGIPSSTDIGYGAGIGHVALQVGAATALLAAMTANTVFSGSAKTVPTALIAATTANAVFSGSAGTTSRALFAATTANAVFSGSAKSLPKALIAAITANTVFSGGASAGICSAMLALTTANAVFQGGAQGQVQQLSLTQADIDAIAAAVWAYTNRVITGPTAEQNADALLSRTWP